MENSTIPNWTIFGTHGVAISLYMMPTLSDAVVYQAAYEFFLDHGTTEPGDDDEKHITIFTDIQAPDMLEALSLALPTAITSFSNILNAVLVFDKSGDVITTLALDEIAVDGEIKVPPTPTYLH